MSMKYDRSKYRGGHVVPMTALHIVVTYRVNGAWWSIVEFQTAAGFCYAWTHVPAPVDGFASEQGALDAATDYIVLVDGRAGWWINSAGVSLAVDHG